MNQEIMKLTALGTTLIDTLRSWIRITPVQSLRIRMNPEESLMSLIRVSFRECRSSILE